MLLSIALLICDFIDTTYYPKLSTIILNLFSTNMKRVHFLDFRPSESSTSGIMVSSITIQVGIDFEDHFQLNGWISTNLNMAFVLSPVMIILHCRLSYPKSCIIYLCAEFTPLVKQGMDLR